MLNTANASVCLLMSRDFSLMSITSSLGSIPHSSEKKKTTQKVAFYVNLAPFIGQIRALE